jgi:hypothetical protein
MINDTRTSPPIHLVIQEQIHVIARKKPYNIKLGQKVVHHHESDFWLGDETSTLVYYLSGSCAVFVAIVRKGNEHLDGGHIVLALDDGNDPFKALVLKPESKRSKRRRGGRTRDNGSLVQRTWDSEGMCRICVQHVGGLKWEGAFVINVVRVRHRGPPSEEEWMVIEDSHRRRGETIVVFLGSNFYILKEVVSLELLVEPKPILIDTALPLRAIDEENHL